jgi:hypothetical protein
MMVTSVNLTQLPTLHGANSANLGGSVVASAVTWLHAPA